MDGLEDRGMSEAVILWLYVVGAAAIHMHAEGWEPLTWSELAFIALWPVSIPVVMLASLLTGSGWKR